MLGLIGNVLLLPFLMIATSRSSFLAVFHLDVTCALQGVGWCGLTPLELYCGLASVLEESITNE